MGASLIFKIKDSSLIYQIKLDKWRRALNDSFFTKWSCQNLDFWQAKNFKNVKLRTKLMTCLCLCQKSHFWHHIIFGKGTSLNWKFKELIFDNWLIAIRTKFKNFGNCILDFTRFEKLPKMKFLARQIKQKLIYQFNFSKTRKFFV